jgi:hypothetical protein
MSNLKRQDLREASGLVKPTVDIRDAWFDVNYSEKKILRGIPVNHPRGYLNGVLVYTSNVQSHDGNIVETRNTVYNVLNWVTEEESKELQLKLF